MAKRTRKLKVIPEFQSEADERQFWETHDSTDYVDWSKAQIVQFAKLRPSTETISLRLPAPLLADIRALANKRDVPYQSLLKVLLSERVAEEWLRHRSPNAPPTNKRQTQGRSGRRKNSRRTTPVVTAE